MSDRTLSDQGHENLSSLFKKDLPRLFLISIDTNSIKLVSKESILFWRQSAADPCAAFIRGQKIGAAPLYSSRTRCRIGLNCHIEIDISHSNSCYDSARSVQSLTYRLCSV
jgi:hypothetical protein